MRRLLVLVIDDRLVVNTHGVLDHSVLHRPIAINVAAEFGDPCKVPAQVSHKAYGSGSIWRETARKIEKEKVTRTFSPYRMRPATAPNASSFR
jgi:hypothetical protein